MKEYKQIKEQWTKRREAMQKLYHDKKWTMKAIADKEGITIERVRVIVGPRKPREKNGQDHTDN